MFFTQRIQRHGRGAYHFYSAEVTVIFEASNPQNVSGLEVGLRLIANSDSLASGQNVILETLKKSDVIWLHVIIPCR